MSQVLKPDLKRPVLCVDNSLKAYKPHAKDSGKEVHIGDGEKGVAHSFFRGGSFETFLYSWADMHCLKF